MKSKTIISKGIFYLLVIGNCIPLILLLMLTVSGMWPYPEIIPKNLSLKYISYVFLGNKDTLKAIISSIMIAILTTGLTLVIAIPASKALAIYKFRGKEFIKVLVLLPIIVPSITITTGIQISMIKVGLTGTFIGVTLIHVVFTLPYAIRILLNVFEILGDKYERQGSILGGNRFQVFRHITLPMIMPGILSAAIMSFTVSLSQYITTFLIGGGKIITIPMILIPYVQGGQVQTAAIYSIIFIFVALISLGLMEVTVKKYYNMNNVLYL